MYLVRYPFLLRKFFPEIICNIPSEEKKLYLTFDDGPIPGLTRWVLDQLKQHKAKGTFFCVGENVRKYPAIYKQIKEEGHSIGNHTFNHLNGYKTKTKDYLNNVEQCAEVVSSNLFRPPYGMLGVNQYRLLRKNYSIILWDVLSGDYDQKTSPQKCLDNVMQYTRPGSILVFHDNVKATANLQYVLPAVLEHFSKEGYTFDGVSIKR